MIVQLAVTLAAWVALMVLTSNLVGFSMGGLVQASEHKFVGDAVCEQRKTAQKTSFFVAALMVTFVVAIFHFWGLGVAAAATMLMLSRVHDLAWEIKHGRKLQTSDMTRPPLWMLSTALSWASLPTLWYAIYRA